MPTSPSRLYVYWQNMLTNNVDTEVNWCLQQGDSLRVGLSSLAELSNSLNMTECTPVLSAIQARIIYQPITSRRRAERDKTKQVILSEAVGSGVSELNSNHIYWREDDTGITAVVIADDHWQRLHDLFRQVGFAINRVYVDADMLTDSTASVGVSWQHGLTLRLGKVQRLGWHKAILSNTEVFHSLVPLSDMKVGLWLGKKPALLALTDWDNELSEATDSELFGELVKRHNPDAVMNLMAPAKDNPAVAGWLVAMVLTFGLLMASWHLYLMELKQQVTGFQQQQLQHLEAGYPGMSWLQDPVQDIQGWLRKTPVDPSWLQCLQALRDYQLLVAGPYKRTTGKDLNMESMQWDAGSLTIKLRPEIDLASVLIVNDDAPRTIQWRPEPPDRGQIVITPKVANAALLQGVE